MKSISYFLLAISFILVSCGQLNKLELKDYPVTPVSAENFRELNGTYSNKAAATVGTYYDSRVDSMPFPATWNVLITALVFNVPQSAKLDTIGAIFDPENETVKIEFTSPKQMTLSFYRNEKLLLSKVIKGKFKKGYFYRRAKWYLVPVFPLCTLYLNDRARIGRSGDYLVVDEYYNELQFLFIAGASFKNKTKSVYPLKKTS